LRLLIQTAICLSALIAVTIQNAHAQSGPITASGNQESTQTNPQRQEPETEPISDAQVIQAPFKHSRLFTKVGFLLAPYHSSATIATNGQIVSGGTAEASNNMSVTFDLGYEITNNISVTVTSGIPVKPHVTGEGAAAALGILGKVRYGPAIFAGQYQFPKIGRFRPYVGGGAAYAIIFKSFDGSVKNLNVHNNWGSVVQGGAEYEVNSRYTLFFDFKEVWLGVNADGVLSDGSPVKARVTLNPSLVTVGIKFHFPFGRSGGH
jgi:outer membrane protein